MNDTVDRFHAFDALRASALLLGIVLHATMSFLVGFRELRFPIVARHQARHRPGTERDGRYVDSSATQPAIVHDP